MRVTDAWLIYILVTLGVFALLSLCAFKLHLDMLTRVFVSLLISAVVILIAIPNIVATGPGDRTWYSILLIIAFIGPLVVAAWLVWVRNRENLGKLLGVDMTQDQPRKEFDCDDTGCQLRKEVKQNGGMREVYNYTPSRKRPAS